MAREVLYKEDFFLLAESAELYGLCALHLGRAVRDHSSSSASIQLSSSTQCHSNQVSKMSNNVGCTDLPGVPGQPERTCAGGRAAVTAL